MMWWISFHHHRGDGDGMLLQTKLWSTQSQIGNKLVSISSTWRTDGQTVANGQRDRRVSWSAEWRRSLCKGPTCLRSNFYDDILVFLDVSCNLYGDWGYKQNTRR